MMVAGRELTTSAWWTVGAIVLCLAALSTAGVWYTSITNRAQDRQWCEYLNIRSEVYRAAPPPAETDRRMADAVERLRRDKGCAR